MFETNLNRQNLVLTIEFLNGPRVVKHEFKVKSEVQAFNVYRTNVSKYLVTTLWKWVKQTRWRIDYSNSMSTRKEYALDALTLMLMNYSESKLESIVFQILKHEDDIRALAPSVQSRYYNYYITNIEGILTWCKTLELTPRK